MELDPVLNQKSQDNTSKNENNKSTSKQASEPRKGYRWAKTAQKELVPRILGSAWDPLATPKSPRIEKKVSKNRLKIRTSQESLSKPI